MDSIEGGAIRYLPGTNDLLARLRQAEDRGGHDGFGPDALHVAAANEIETWIAQYEAWRKRAEEAEKESKKLLDAIKEARRLSSMDMRYVGNPEGVMRRVDRLLAKQLDGALAKAKRRASNREISHV